MSVKLIIRDEVNIKFEGLPLEARRKISNALKFTLPYARYMPRYKLGRWDGTVTLFGLGGNGYLNHLEVILPILTDLGIDIEEVEDLRQKTTLSFTKIDENYVSDQSWPKGHPAEGQPIMLRDYQIEVINRFLENPQSLQEVATGAGKTIITACLSKLCEPYGRTLVIVPNKSLVTQTEKDYKNIGLDVGVYFGDRKELGKTHTICTWQSVNILDKKSKDSLEDAERLAEFLENIAAVIVDEVHQAKAEVLKKLLTTNLCNTPIRWGLTGTIPKEEHEFESIKASLGQVIGKLSASELQDMGHLAQCHVNVLQTMEYKEFQGYPEELKYLVTDQDRMTYISKLCNTVSESGNTLILVDRLDAGRIITENVKDSVFISGRIKVKDREEEYDEIQTADNKVIVATYGVAAVGINIPRIFNLVLIEPGKSFVRVIQSIGRGIRKAEDKDFVQIWDITANTKYAKRHLTERKKFYKEAKYPFTIEKIDWR